MYLKVLHQKYHVEQTQSNQYCLQDFFITHPNVLFIDPNIRVSDPKIRVSDPNIMVSDPNIRVR